MKKRDILLGAKIGVLLRELKELLLVALAAMLSEDELLFGLADLSLHPHIDNIPCLALINRLLPIILHRQMRFPLLLLALIQLLPFLILAVNGLCHALKHLEQPHSLLSDLRPIVVHQLHREVSRHALVPRLLPAYSPRLLESHVGSHRSKSKPHLLTVASSAPAVVFCYLFCVSAWYQLARPLRLS